MNTLEKWKCDWNAAFTAAASESALKMPHVVQNRTFVRVQMLSKEMMETWFDLLRQNDPNVITPMQLHTRMPGPCKLFMCYLTSNHTDFRDPLSISCIVPMYTNKSIICYQGLMQLSKTLVGPENPHDPLTLLIMSSRMAEQSESSPCTYIFISPLPRVGVLLREVLEKKEIKYTRCKSDSLSSVHLSHSSEKCDCDFHVGDWGVVGIDISKGTCHLPQMYYRGTKLGYVNVPWASGMSCDIMGDNELSCEDEGIAVMTKDSHSSIGVVGLSRDISFLSVLSGIDGIHIIDFNQFIKIDPLEIEQILTSAMMQS
jgi:hypothetical protein